MSNAFKSVILLINTLLKIPPETEKGEEAGKLTLNVVPLRLHCTQENSKHCNRV